MMHIAIPVDQLVVSIDDDAVLARGGEADEPEGTAPPVEVEISLTRNSEFVWMGLRAPVSLALARLMVGGRVGDVRVRGAESMGEKVSDFMSNYE